MSTTTETTVVLTGVLEDELGRKLMPDTYAAQVVHGDGETTEYKLSNLVKVSNNMSVTMAGTDTKKIVDLSSYITDRPGHIYLIDVVNAAAEGESPVATVYAETIGTNAVFYRAGVSATKSIDITFRLVIIAIS